MREYLAEKRLAAEVGVMLAARRMKECVKNFFVSEEGDTNFVAIIIIIVILIVIAAIFQKQLKAAVESVFTNLSGFIGNSKNIELETGTEIPK